MPSFPLQCVCLSHSIPSFYPTIISPVCICIICIYSPVVKHDNLTLLKWRFTKLRKSFMNGGFASTLRLITEGYNVPTSPVMFIEFIGYKPHEH